MTWQKHFYSSPTSVLPFSVQFKTGSVIKSSVTSCSLTLRDLAYSQNMQDHCIMRNGLYINWRQRNVLNTKCLFSHSPAVLLSLPKTQSHFKVLLSHNYEAFIGSSSSYVQTVFAHSRGCKGVCGGHEKATTLRMGAWVLKRVPVLYDINGLDNITK